MTKPWIAQPAWKGETVAVLATGPSMSEELALQLRRHRTIAVNAAIRVAPWADMLVSLDANWSEEQRAFEGLRLTGIEDESLDAFYIGHRSVTVALTANHRVSIRNSGLAAIRIAAEMGAARILLAGFDYPVRRGYFYDDEVDTGEYVGLEAGLRQITAELVARGVAMEHAALSSLQATVTGY